MRLPNRKPGKYAVMPVDTTMTQDKLEAMHSKLKHLKEVVLPQAIKDTQRYGENGDFSENAEYQIAKGRLRGLHRQIDELNYKINHAVVIELPKTTDTVQIGHYVTITTPAGDKTFQILGSSESNPSSGVISHRSPLGAALLNHKVGDVITVPTQQKALEYTISKIAVRE